MKIETTEDLCNQLADWIGVYGCCKGTVEQDGACKFDDNPLCCRVGFMIEMQQRIKDAVENDKKLEQIGLVS